MGLDLQIWGAWPDLEVCPHIYGSDLQIWGLDIRFGGLTHIYGVRPPNLGLCPDLEVWPHILWGQTSKSGGSDLDLEVCPHIYGVRPPHLGSGLQVWRSDPIFMGSDLQNDNYCHFGSGPGQRPDPVWPKWQFWSFLAKNLTKMAKFGLCLVILASFAGQSRSFWSAWGSFRKG